MRIYRYDPQTHRVISVSSKTMHPPAIADDGRIFLSFHGQFSLIFASRVVLQQFLAGDSSVRPSVSGGTHTRMGLINPGVEIEVEVYGEQTHGQRVRVVFEKTELDRLIPYAQEFALKEVSRYRDMIVIDFIEPEQFGVRVVRGIVFLDHHGHIVRVTGDWDGPCTPTREAFLRNAAK